MSLRPRTRAAAKAEKARTESEERDGAALSVGGNAEASSQTTGATTRRLSLERPAVDVGAGDGPGAPASPMPISTDALSTPVRRRASSASRAPAMSPLDPISPWPPAEPEAPYTADLPSAKEVYGLLGVLLTYLAFAIYLVWAFAPSSWLDRIGWTWYPNRQWAVVVPCWLMILVLTTYWSYAALTTYLVPSFDDPYIIADERSNIPAHINGAAVYYWKFAEPHTVPEAVDLPIDLVNRVLYPPRPRPRLSS